MLPYVTVSLLQHESPRVGSETHSFDWVYIDDVVDALLRCAVCSEGDARSIDVGTGTLTSVRALIERVVEITSYDVAVQFGAIPDRVLEPSRVARVEETKRLTGWLVRSDGARRWTCENGLLVSIELEEREAAGRLTCGCPYHRLCFDCPV